MADQIFQLTSPLGPDLLFNRMSGEERLSHLYRYDLDLLSPKADIDPEDLLGKPVTVHMGLQDGSDRYFTGYVTQFSEGATEGNRYAYYATLRPWLWFLTRNADCRIFQALKVPDILDQIFSKYPNIKKELRLTGEYRVWNYCVQYRETDFNFVSRLMEQEGIYYYFEHSADGHTLVLADSPSAHKPFPAFDTFPYLASGVQAREGVDSIRDWRFTKAVKTAKFEARDYNFETPSADLTSRKTGLKPQVNADAEVYDYPGGYMALSDGENYAGLRMDEMQTPFERSLGSGDVRALGAGYTFSLVNFPRAAQNKKYLVTRTTYKIATAGYGAGHLQAASYAVDFEVIPSDTQFRPKRSTRKPFVQGPQTAKVVGPAADEIYTDKYGRVKVQFFWDRLGKEDENSSCWIRVSHPWAGKNWGMIAIPRINQEVIVDFLEGDPDQPIITGRVYNAEQMPPYDLPANATQTGVKTRSSKGGSGANCNELRFEDKMGSEQLFIHAEKNQDIEVENDETHWVGHDRSKKVDNNETVKIGVDRTEEVGSNEKITIGSNRTESVGANEKIDIGANRTETVGGNESVTVSGNQTHSISGNKDVTIGGKESLTVGATQTISVGASRSDTVGASMTQTIGGSLTQTVTGGITINTPGAFKVTAAGGVTFVAPGGSKFVDFQFTKFGGQNQAAYSMNIEGYVLHNESSAIATAQKIVSIEASLVKNAQVVALMNKAAVKLLSTDSAVLDSAGVKLAKAALTLFT